MSNLLGEIAIVGLHLVSYHEEHRKHQYNDMNYGAYVVTDKGYAGGTFLNSAKRNAPWLGKQFKHYDSSRGYDLAVLTGLLWGYSSKPTTPIPLVSLSGAKHFGDFAFRVNYSPEYRRLKNSSAVWHLTLEKRL